MDVDREEWPLHPQDSYDSQQARAQPPKSDPELAQRMHVLLVRMHVLLVHIKGHPHVLALRNQGTNCFRLPGILPGESERDGLKRKVKQFLINADPSVWCEWKVGELLTMRWCPSFRRHHTRICRNTLRDGRSA